MVKNLVIFAFFLLGLTGCETTNTNSIDKYYPNNQVVNINVVEKVIIQGDLIEGIHSNKLNKYIIQWLQNDVKTNGFKGKVQIKIKSISGEEEIINDTVKIKISSSIEFIISKSALDSKKKIILNGNEFGELSGQFSLNEKTIEVENTIKRLIEKFSLKLYSELN